MNKINFIPNKKKWYSPTEYCSILEFCIRTTGLDEKAESIIETIAKKYRENGNISYRQFEALHNISIHCLQVDRRQTELRKIDFEK